MLIHRAELLIYPMTSLQRSSLERDPLKGYLAASYFQISH